MSLPTTISDYIFLNQILMSPHLIEEVFKFKSLKYDNNSV